MLKIGEFSKLSRVSVRMLRHYDEIGLLKPAEIDRFTEYRYYREDQLPTAGRIAALKDMGFSLADIVRILEVYDDRDQLEQFFSARQRELETISQDTAHKLALLDAARKRLRKEEDMNYNVTLKTIPERYAATIHMTIPRYEDEGIIWGKLAEETCRMNLVEDDPCLCAVTYLDGEYKEENAEFIPVVLAQGGIAFIREKGKLLDPHTVQAGEKKITSEYIVLGVGQRNASKLAWRSGFWRCNHHIIHGTGRNCRNSCLPVSSDRR